MDKKYGVYICTGCGIGDALDMEALCGVPEEEGLPVATHPFLCGKEGVELIKKDNNTDLKLYRLTDFGKEMLESIKNPR